MVQRTEQHGHAALVTGGGRRLGRAFVEALAANGADVAIHYGASADGARRALAAVEAAGRRGVVLQADLADPAQASRLVDQACEAFGAIDWLVNSAAIFEPLAMAETTFEAWERHLAIDLTAPFLLTQAFASRRQGRPGAVVNLLDWRALRPGSDHFAYTIAKAGLAALTRSLAIDLAPAIRVNGLALGAILPPPEATDPEAPPPPGAPIGRWATLEETTSALLFLLSGPDFMTGEILHLDGGRHLV
jgi:NAD(P)-dependent dehydrogenase (short-subunit alcohol dehydrogenase family)